MFVTIFESEAWKFSIFKAKNQCLRPNIYLLLLKTIFLWESWIKRTTFNDIFKHSQKCVLLKRRSLWQKVLDLTSWVLIQGGSLIIHQFWNFCTFSQILCSLEKLKEFKIGRRQTCWIFKRSFNFSLPNSFSRMPHIFWIWHHFFHCGLCSK